MNLNGITVDALLLGEHASFEPAGALTAEQMQRDVDILVYGLEQGYGGRRFVPPAPFEAAIRQLQAIRPTNRAYGSKEFCEAIDRILFTIPDNATHRNFNLGFTPTSPAAAYRPQAGAIVHRGGP